MLHNLNGWELSKFEASKILILYKFLLALKLAFQGKQVFSVSCEDFSVYYRFYFNHIIPVISNCSLLTGNLLVIQYPKKCTIGK